MENLEQTNTTTPAAEGFTVSAARPCRVIDEYLDSHFDFDPGYQCQLRIADILAGATQARIVLGGSIRAQAMTIGRLLVLRGATKVHTSAGARWNGIRWKA